MADGPLILRRNPERDFELIKQIGSGTYGEVYKAKFVKNGQLCALKIIKIEPGEDFNIIQQEIAILSECKHQNIVGYCGSYLSEGWDPVVEEVRKDRLWIAMEYCGGGSLQDIYHAQGGGLNELQIAFVCRETLQGLDYLHERNKMHRDIKGANILLTDNGDVKLADFGIAAQLTQTLVKRKSFIGTPYWMAPEVAAVERKGGYNQQCDVWAVGITAVELAETQPPMFDLHPMRALYLMTKKSFKPPTLQHKNKWSPNFHDFLVQALKKDPRTRPTAHDLLKHEFVNRLALSNVLMLSLIRVLEAPSRKQNRSTSEETDEEDDGARQAGGRNDRLKRISSVKQHGKIDRQVSEMAVNIQAPRHEAAQGPMPAWLASAAAGHKPRITRILSDAQPPSFDNANADAAVYQSVDSMYNPNESSPVGGGPSRPLPPSPAETPHDVPPVPPRAGGGGVPPLPHRRGGAHEQEEAENHVYGNTTQHNPPVPPRHRDRPPSQPTPSTPQAPPVVPPRTRNTDQSSHQKQRKRREETERKAYFSKIFNGCPLKLLCASSWVHPFTGCQYVLLGAEEGLFSLLVTAQQDPVMEQVSPRPCQWLRVVENVLIWLSDQTRIVSMTNLILLFQNDSQRGVSGHGRRTHTSKIDGSKGCTRCCCARNPFSDQRYLLAAVPRGMLVMQWYQPRHAFMHVKLFEYTLPSPLVMFEAFVNEEEEYPSICLGVCEGKSGGVDFNVVNLNVNATFFSDQIEQGIEVLSLQQLEKDTVFVATNHYARFVDCTGALKPSTIQASQLFFDRKAESMVYLQNCVLSFHKHGMQGKSLATQQVTAEVTDNSKVFTLLGSHGSIIIMTRPYDDPSTAYNIYILISEEKADP